MDTVFHLSFNAISIAILVSIMMTLVEYLNVASKGLAARAVGSSKWNPYLLAAVFGLIPGCLGIYALVAMHTHGLISIGALITGLIATSGDEAFLMLAMFPKTAIVMFLGMAALGMLAGWLHDSSGTKKAESKCSGFKIHEHDEDVRVFPGWSKLAAQLRAPSLIRLVLGIGLVGFVLLSSFGIGSHEHGSNPISELLHTVTIALGIGAFLMVLSVPDHFLESHIWKHVVREHLPSIFLWVVGTLVLLHGLEQFYPTDSISSFIQERTWYFLAIASLLGLLPTSGPHIIFVTMFASGQMPLAILVASSISQDGHGSLPLLACSRRKFVQVKVINFAWGFLAGAVMLLLTETWV